MISYLMSNFYRKAVRADFATDDKVFYFGFQGSSSYVTSQSYEALSRFQQRAMQGWLVLFGSILFMLSVGMLYGAFTLPLHEWYAKPIALLLAWFFGYQSLMVIGFWRWTCRH